MVVVVVSGVPSSPAASVAAVVVGCDKPAAEEEEEEEGEEEEGAAAAAASVMRPCHTNERSSLGSNHKLSTPLSGVGCNTVGDSSLRLNLPTETCTRGSHRAFNRDVA